MFPQNVYFDWIFRDYDFRFIRRGHSQNVVADATIINAAISETGSVQLKEQLFSLRCRFVF